MNEAEMLHKLHNVEKAFDALLQQNKQLTAALREIATQDYRGPRPFEQTIAERALAGKFEWKVGY